MTCAVLCTGAMGSEIARALLRQRHRVTVWNRTPHTVASLIGATPARSVEEAVADADVVFALPHPASALFELLPDAALAGKTLVVMSSYASLEEPKQLAEWAKAQRATLLDAKIFGYPRDVGKIPIIYAGERSAFDRHHALFAAFGTPLYVGADISHASVLEAAATSWYVSAAHGLLNVVALCRRADVPAQGLLEILGEITPGLLRYGALTVNGPIDPVAHGTTSIAGLSYVSEHFAHLFETHGIPAALTETARAAMKTSIAAGDGAADLSVVFKVKS